MRLKVFDTIDATLDLLEKNHSVYRAIEDELHKDIEWLMQDKREMVVDINSRIKSKDSLREKIIRNRFYAENNNAQEILDHLSDLIGFIIECRFIEDEFNVLNLLREKMNIRNEVDGYYYCEEYPDF